MKKFFLYFAFSLMSIALLSFVPKTKNDLASKLQNLNGTYADPEPYAYGEGWGSRVFTFKNGRWTLHFTLALDPGMNMKVFEFRTFGTYRIQDQSTMLSNTYNAVFLEEKKLLTLKTDDPQLIKAFGFESCNLKPNIESDISEKGCSGWKSVDDCPGDYDLLTMDAEGKLYFGNRPPDNDMCSPEKRPKSLTPPVIKTN